LAVITEPAIAHAGAAVPLGGDAYLTLKQLVAYSAISERWLRELMRKRPDPLPSTVSARRCWSSARSSMPGCSGAVHRTPRSRRTMPSAKCWTGFALDMEWADVRVCATLSMKSGGR
jgi:hypothetical protein